MQVWGWKQKHGTRSTIEKYGGERHVSFGRGANDGMQGT